MVGRQHGSAAVATAGSCAICVAGFTEAETGLLPDTDVEVSREHRAQCPDCRLFTEQLDTTRDVLAASAAVDLTDRPAAGNVRFAANSGLDDWSLEKLYRVATALGLDDVDDALQQVVLDELSRGGALDERRLIDALAGAAVQHRTVATVDLSEADHEPADHDPDSETAQLFYPDFYEQGPDAGRFVDSPNDWGHLPRLAPEDEVGTLELYAATDAAIEELPDTEGRLITLVDIEGLPFEQAATGLGLDTKPAAQALNRARIHVRGAIDDHLR